MQADFALALLREARKRRIDTCIETCGQVPWEVLEQAGRYLNSVCYDIKSMDKTAHIQYVGASNELILDNLVKLKQTYPDLLVRIRTPFIPGFNDNTEAIGDIIDFIRDMGYPWKNRRTKKLPWMLLETVLPETSSPPAWPS